MLFYSQKLKQPFFAGFFSLSSHHPFKVPEKYVGKFPKGPLEVQEPVGYTDLALKNFFASAKQTPWYKNTLFVLCADHATVSYLPEYKTEKATLESVHVMKTRQIAPCLKIIILGLREFALEKIMDIGLHELP